MRSRLKICPARYVKLPTGFDERPLHFVACAAGCFRGGCRERGTGQQGAAEELPAWGAGRCAQKLAVLCIWDSQSAWQDCCQWGHREVGFPVFRCIQSGISAGWTWICCWSAANAGVPLMCWRRTSGSMLSFASHLVCRNTIPNGALPTVREDASSSSSIPLSVCNGITEGKARSSRQSSCSQLSGDTSAGASTASLSSLAQHSAKHSAAPSARAFSNAGQAQAELLRSPQEATPLQEHHKASSLDGWNSVVSTR